MEELKSFEAPLAALDEELFIIEMNSVAAAAAMSMSITSTDNNYNNNLRNKNASSSNGSLLFGGLGSSEGVTGSLEDLVNTFDEKIMKCFCDFGENTEKLAPVQMRSQEELVNDCQMWWTITGNYGNMLPIDWSKTYANKLHINATVSAVNNNNKNDRNMNNAMMNSKQRKKKRGLPSVAGTSFCVDDDDEDDMEEMFKEDYDEDATFSDEDEAVANDLDMHSLILGSSGNSGLRGSGFNDISHHRSYYCDGTVNRSNASNGNDSLGTVDDLSNVTSVPTADEVIREIDFIMQEAANDDLTGDLCCSCDDFLDEADFSEQSRRSFKVCNFCRNLANADKGAGTGKNKNLNDKNGTVAPVAECNKNPPFYEEKLERLSATELNEILLELECQIKSNSEILISELALRDELEFEKELKNSFISHLLAVQTKRRQLNLGSRASSTNSNSNHANSNSNYAHSVNRNAHSSHSKKVTENGTRSSNYDSTSTSSCTTTGGTKAIHKNGGVETNALRSKYLTTVIPYHAGNGPPKNSTLQVLIKILKAIEQDNPNVPTLLTDYILKVLCPT